MNIEGKQQSFALLLVDRHGSFVSRRIDLRSNGESPGQSAQQLGIPALPEGRGRDSHKLKTAASSGQRSARTISRIYLRAEWTAIPLQTLKPATSGVLQP